MLARILGWLLWLINLSICSTLKYKVDNAPPGHSLFAFWHTDLFPLFYWGSHRKICILPTEIWRGEIIDFTAKKYGLKTFRFLETQNPLQRAAVLEEFMQAIREGYDAAIAVDGPPPPLVYHKAKTGIIYLSQKTGVPIVPCGIFMKNKIVLFWRWDRLAIPLPWSKVEINFGDPFLATEGTTTQELGAKIDALSGE